MAPLVNAAIAYVERNEGGITEAVDAYKTECAQAAKADGEISSDDDMPF